MAYLIYFVIILLANTIGSLSGMGGGVIIKPALDTLGFHPLNQISFFSTSAVFTMSIVSLYRQSRLGFSISKQRALAIAVGSLAGGLLGSSLLRYLMSYFTDLNQVQLVQIIVTLIALTFVVIYTLKDLPTLNRQSHLAFFLTSLGLAAISSLLSIGGGPINVSTLILVTGMPMKEATIYSILTIFFSQLASLVSTLFTTNLASYDLTYLLAIIPAAILGGSLGSQLNNRLNEKQISKAFLAVTIGVIALNVYNLIQLLY